MRRDGRVRGGSERVLMCECLIGGGEGAIDEL